MKRLSIKQRHCSRIAMASPGLLISLASPASTEAVSGVGEWPRQSNFYPPDASRDEVDRWLATLTADERAAAFPSEVRHVIDRLKGVPVDIAPRFVTAEEFVSR